MADELILIVEDNEKNLKLARDVLQFRGFRTLEASTAEQAIDLAMERQPDLVLMDYQLPGINGVEALKILRADPKTAEIPVVALTASAMREDRERFLAAGFDGYLTKPIDVREFGNQVRSYLNSGSEE
jgi:two-component system, cell cycle response regulator DivK